MKNAFAFLFALLATLGIASAQVTDAASLGTELTSGLGDITPTLWTVGGVMAGIVAVVVTVGALLRNGKRVGSNA